MVARFITLFTPGRNGAQRSCRAGGVWTPEEEKGKEEE